MKTKTLLSLLNIQQEVSEKPQFVGANKGNL